MAKKKLVWGINACMDNGQGKGQRMGIIFDRMHEASLAGIDFQCTMANVTRQQRFHGIAFLTLYPFRLGKCAVGCRVAALENIAIGITSIGARLYVCDAFDVCWDCELDMDELQVFDPKEARVIVDQLDVISKIRRAGAG